MWAGWIWALMIAGTSHGPSTWRTIALPPDAHGEESDVIELAASHDALAIAVAGPTRTAVFTTVDGGTTWFEVGGKLPPRPYGPGGDVLPGALEAIATRGGRVFMVATVDVPGGVARERRLFSSGLTADGWDPIKLGTSTEVVAVAASSDVIYAATKSELWSSPNGFDWTRLRALDHPAHLAATDIGVLLDDACGAGEHALTIAGGRVAGADIGVWVNQSCVANEAVALVATENGVWRTFWSSGWPSSAWAPVAGIDAPVRAVGVYYKWLAALVQPPGAAPYIAVTPLAGLSD